MRFLGIIFEVSVYNVYIETQFQTTFTQGGGGGGVKSVSRGDCKWQGGKLVKTFVPITSKNSASGGVFFRYEGPEGRYAEDPGTPDECGREAIEDINFLEAEQNYIGCKFHLGCRDS